MSVSADDESHRGTLFDQAVQAVMSGRLPRAATLCGVGGPGAGQRCHLCEQPIGASEALLEFEVPGRPGRFALHFYCCHFWEAACAHREA